MKKPEESTTPSEDKHSINWGALILWPFLILILYVLSIGPVWMLMAKGNLSTTGKSLDKFYRPLQWAYQKTPFHRPLGKCTRLHLWAPTMFDKKGELGN